MHHNPDHNVTSHLIRNRPVRERTAHPFAVNLNVSRPQTERIAACADAGVPAVSLFWGLSADAISSVSARGMLVSQTIGSAEEARIAVDLGADAVVAHGWEAGSHVRGRVGTMALIPAVVDAVGNIPVAAAGGIADGRRPTRRRSTPNIAAISCRRTKRRPNGTMTCSI